MRRSSRDRKIAGVCGGLGEHFNVDPTIFRIAFAASAFAGGAGVLVYLLFWIFVEEE
ncbi:MAG: PspC domain-containing protein [Actinomycetota bacterium]